MTVWMDAQIQGYLADPLEVHLRACREQLLLPCTANTVEEQDSNSDPSPIQQSLLQRLSHFNW